MYDIISVYNGSMKKGCWLRLHMLASKLAEENHRVYLVVPASFDFPEQENIEKITFPRIEMINNLGGLSKILSAVIAAYTALKLARKISRPAWVSFDTHNAVHFLAKPLFSTKKILFIRGEARYQGRYNEPYLYGIFMRLLNRHIKRSADVIIYNNRASQFSGEQTLGPKHPPSYVIPNNTRFAALRNVRAQHEPFTLGYCGQFTKRKNVELLIKAFELLEAGAYKLILKGDWNKHDWVKPYLSEKKYPGIEFQPWSNDIEIFYQSIDLFILPSLFDDFSNAALDAIGHGLPVVLSKTGGSPEMVNYKEEFLIDVRQGPGALASRIRWIKKNYSTACSEIKEIAGRYRFDWATEVVNIVQREAERDTPCTGPR